MLTSGDELNEYQEYQRTVIAVQLAFEQQIPDQILEDFVVNEAERLIARAAIERGVIVSPTEAFRAIVTLAGEGQLTYDGITIAVRRPFWLKTWQRLNELIRAFVEWIDFPNVP